MLIKTIRGRFQLWLAFLLVCVLSGFGITLFQLQRVQQLKQIDEELELRVAALSGALRGGPRPEPGFRFDPESSKRPRNESVTPPDFPMGPPPFMPPRGGERRMHFGPREFQVPPQTASLFDETRTNDFYYQVWSWDGSVLKQSTNAPPGLELPERTFGTLLRKETVGTHRQAFLYTEMGDCVLVGRSIEADLAAMRMFMWGLLAAGLAVLALGMGGGWRLVTHALRPIEDISSAAAKIAAGDLSQRINTAETENELGRLAGVLNSTFSRLEAAFNQQGRFTADAAHELRTPVSVLLTHAQNGLASPGLSEEQREAFEACQRAGQRMRRLIESLLQLARLDAGQEPMKREAFDLSCVAQECVEMVRPLAAERKVAIVSELSPTECHGDAERIGQVIMNLLTNGIYFNKDGGEVRISTQAAEGSITLSVSDTGQGIPAEDLPHVFERFYRVDKSRSGTQGRTGLGLAICKAIMEAHGGTITVSSQPGSGSVFKATIPR
jgi:heavy metal sensor kinase